MVYGGKMFLSMIDLHGLMQPEYRQVAALKGYERTHLKAMDLWEAVYPDVMLVALTDTFTTEAFYKVWFPSVSLLNFYANPQG